MSSQTPGRRSTRERRSPRNASPMNTRGPRMSSLSNVETVQAQGPAGDDASPQTSVGGDLAGKENTAAHSLHSTTTPTVSTTRPWIHMRLKPPTPQDLAAANSSRTSPRPRKSGRMSEITKEEAPTSSGNEQDDEITTAAAASAAVAATKGSNRVEESGDDDYNPTGKQVKIKRAKKSLDPVNVTRTEQTMPRENALAAKHQATVQAAIQVARDKNNNVLAVTLKLLYQQSLYVESLAHLLEAILVQTADEQQTAEFQTHVKAARKEARALVNKGLSDSDFMLSGPLPKQPKPASPTKPAAPKKATQTPSSVTTKTQQLKKQSIDTAPLPTGRGRPSAAVAARARGIGKQAASPPPVSTRQPATSRYGTPSQAEPVMTTRNSKKRPSATPEPSTRAQLAVNGDIERPRKRARRSSGGNQVGDIAMQDVINDSLNDLSGSDSTLSELHHSSPEPSAELMAAENALGGNGHLSSTVHGFRKGGRKLKQKPEPGQKVKTTAATKHGIGLPDDQMMDERQRYAAQYNRFGPEPTFSEMRDMHEPSGLPRSRRPPAIDIDGVFTPSAREQLERQSLQSPATSSIHGELLIPPPPEFARLSSRASTPALNGRSARGSRQGQASRMKNSPVKKKTAFAGGIGSFASAGGRDSPVGMQTDGESGNIDYCVTCGDSGDLVCCDGCPRAFHLLCCDPPYDEDHPPESETWYCAVCTGKREVVPRPPRSLFSTLVHDVRRHNAIKFGLPKSLQNYFEGVHANDEGEYVIDEAIQAKHRTRATGLTDADAETLKIRDGKGNFVLCFSCGLSSAGKREIIKCDYCSLHWHLDCLDPPPANPPVRPSLDGRPRPLWKCPAHAINDRYLPGESRSKHKIRRPRNASVVDTMLNRGFRNNGNIEIENDPSDDEEMNGDDGTVYRVKESSIKLDFIDRIRRVSEYNLEEQRKRDEEVRRARNAELEARFDFQMRSFADQRAALNLLEFNNQPGCESEGNSTRRASSFQTSDRSELQQLLHQLITEAPPQVLAMIADDPPKRPSISGVAGQNGLLSPHPTTTPGPSGHTPRVHDRRILLMLQSVIDQKLREIGENTPIENGESVNGS